MYYVYEWFIVETGEIIYVGKGTRNRYKVRKHNRFFNDMIKRFECSSRIIKTFETEKEAFDYEFERVLELKIQGQCVCNIHSGGYGGTTECWSNERRQKYSECNVMRDQRQRERMSNNNPMKDQSVAKRVGEKHKKKICVDDRIYDGLQDVSVAYNVSPQLFLYWLERGYTNKKEQCYYLGTSPKELLVLKHGNTVKRAIMIDGIRYESIREAAKAIDCNCSYLSKALRKNKPIKGHSCCYSE